MSLSIPRVNCCFGLPIELGAKIIALVQLVLFSVISILGFALLIYKATKLQMYSYSYSFGNYTESQNEEEAVMSLDILTDVSFTFQTIFSGYLVYGIYKEKFSYIKAWIVVQVAFIIQSLLSVLVLTIIMITENEFHFGALMEIIISGIQAYCILIINNYYTSRQTNGPSPLVNQDI